MFRTLTKDDRVAFWDQKRSSFVVGTYVGPDTNDLPMFNKLVSPEMGTWPSVIEVRVDDSKAWPVKPKSCKGIVTHGNYHVTSFGIKACDWAKAEGRIIATVPPANMMILKAESAFPPGKIPWKVGSVIVDLFVNPEITTVRDALLANASDSLVYANKERMRPDPAMAAALLRVALNQATNEDVALVGSLCPTVPDRLVAKRISAPLDVDPPKHKEYQVTHVEFRDPYGDLACPNATFIPALESMAKGEYHIACNGHVKLNKLSASLMDDDGWEWHDVVLVDPSLVPPTREGVKVTNDLIRKMGIAAFALPSRPEGPINGYFERVIGAAVDPERAKCTQAAIDYFRQDACSFEEDLRHTLTMLRVSSVMVVEFADSITGIPDLLVGALKAKKTDRRGPAPIQALKDFAGLLKEKVTVEFINEMRKLEIDLDQVPQPNRRLIAGLIDPEIPPEQIQRAIVAVDQVDWVDLGDRYTPDVWWPNHIDDVWHKFAAAAWIGSDSVDINALWEAVEMYLDWRKLGVFQPKMSAVPVIPPLSKDLIQAVANLKTDLFMDVLEAANYMPLLVREIKHAADDYTLKMPRDAATLERVFEGLDGPCLEFGMPICGIQSDKVWMLVVNGNDEVTYAGVVYADYRDELPTAPASGMKRGRESPPAIRVINADLGEPFDLLALLRHLRGQ